MNTKKRNIGIFIIIFLIFAFLIYLNAFSNVRSTITDSLYGNNKIIDNILIIEIDDESINKIGRWPWEREVHANLLKKIEDAKAIGIDVSFFEPSNNDKSLKQQLESMDNVILAAEINEGILYKSIFNTTHGYVNLKTDRDGVTRTIEPNLRPDLLPFAFEIYKQAWNQDAIFQKEPYLINFAAGPGSFHTMDYYDALNNEYDFSKKIILIGATAPNLHDTYFVPTSDGIAMAGVEIHANILQNLILNNFLKKQSTLSIILFVLIAGLIGFFFLSRLKIYYSVPIILLTILIYELIAIYIFNKFNLIVDLLFTPLTLIIFTGIGLGINYIEERQKSQHLKNAFGKYISKDLLKEIIEHKHKLKLGGQKKEITIFFSDIRSFTTISENLTPEQLVSLLNDYLTEMTQIILKHKGTVDKFIGDAIMAFWNAPVEEKEHAELACKAAIEQIKTLRELEKKWVKEGYPVVKVGCGIHTGEAIIGNMGSEDRFDYTAMGDTINLGSRLEGITKQYYVAIVISESTYNIIKDKFKCRKLDAVKVKGKKKPVTIYELCIDYDEKFVKQYEKALDLYFKKKFKHAITEFKKALKIKKGDVSCNLFIDRCNEYIRSPPPKDWDGAYEMKSK